jgi:ribonuclease HI
MPPRPTAPNLFAESPRPITPTAEWINAHCDGGARGNPGPSGYGALIQDGHGMVIAELSEFLGMRTNNYAEYSGLLGCLQYALDHNHPRLRVVSDSELMVKQIQGKYQVKSPDLKPLYEEAKRRIAKLQAFEISHALRHKNKDADRLANEAMDRGMRRGQSSEARPHAPGTPAPPPLKATPYPTRSEAPTQPGAPRPAFADVGGAPPQPPSPTHSKADTMLRGFTKDGVVHILGNASLPDGIFVKIIRE